MLRVQICLFREIQVVWSNSYIIETGLKTVTQVSPSIRSALFSAHFQHDRFPNSYLNSTSQICLSKALFSAASASWEQSLWAVG